MKAELVKLKNEMETGRLNEIVIYLGPKNDSAICSIIGVGDECVEIKLIKEDKTEEDVRALIPFHSINMIECCYGKEKKS